MALGASSSSSRVPAEIVDPDAVAEEATTPSARVVGRRVDRAGRISILKHCYHVGRHLTGRAVTVESADGPLRVSHDGIVVATHARRHPADDDDRMGPPSSGIQTGSTHRRTGGPAQGRHLRVGELRRDLLPGRQPLGRPRSRGPCGGRTIQITQAGTLLRTHRARHDKAKEFGALANPTGRPRRSTHDVA